jgi:hypothetical protein
VIEEEKNWSDLKWFISPLCPDDLSHLIVTKIGRIGDVVEIIEFLKFCVDRFIGAGSVG